MVPKFSRMVSIDTKVSPNLFVYFHFQGNPGLLVIYCHRRLLNYCFRAKMCKPSFDHLLNRTESSGELFLRVFFLSSLKF